MLKFVRSVSLAAVLCGAASMAPADTAGKYESPLIEAMLAVSSGECPARLFGEPLKSNCDRQLPKIHDLCTQLGALKEVTFEGVQPKPGKAGKAERYKVTFENGDWLWYVDLASDGKIHTLWAPQGPNFNAGTSKAALSQNATP